jgi:hypothetical protein
MGDIVEKFIRPRIGGIMNIKENFYIYLYKRSNVLVNEKTEKANNHAVVTLNLLNDASNNSSIVACVFITAVMFFTKPLPSNEKRNKCIDTD